MITATKSPSIALRPYQHEALAAIDYAVNHPKHWMSRPLVVLPTGTGKTVIFAHLIASQPRDGDWGLRALILVHRDELVRQTCEKLEMVDASLSVGVVKAERNEMEAEVIVASVQTLGRPDRLEQLAKYRPDWHGDYWDEPEEASFQVVIVDEAHHATAPTYRRVLDRLDWRYCIGFTATPERGDKAGLGQVWDGIVYQKSILEMITAGYLSDLRAMRITLRADLDQVHTRHGDFI
jgi:superfamily II DNA or RNA helicase